VDVLLDDPATVVGRSESGRLVVIVGKRDMDVTVGGVVENTDGLPVIGDSRLAEAS